MNNIKRYNIFILLSTLSRNIPEVYSAVLLYKMDYSLKDILLFFTVLYLLGALTSVITIYILNKIKSKYILILSSIIFSLSFYYMSIMSKTTKSLLIFSIIYSIGSYTYHTLRHYYAIKALEDNKKENIGNILIFTNIAIILSSLIGGYIQSKLSTFALALFVVILSIVSFIPLFKFEASIGKEKIKYQKWEKIINVMAVVGLLILGIFITVPCCLDIPYLLSNNLVEVTGEVTQGAMSGENSNSERRIHIRDEKTGEEHSLKYWGTGSDLGDKITVRYLPHTEYGYVVE